MRKNRTRTKLVALSVSAALAPAVAQADSSNVTIYGLIDAYYAHATGSNAAGKQTVNAVQSGQTAGSRLGFRGSEDLGGGLSAVFTIENGFAVDNGSVQNADSTVAGASIFTRQAWVGLKYKGVGTFSLGRQYSPGYFMFLSGHGGDWYVLGPIQTLLGKATDSGSAAGLYQAATPSRVSNSFVYQSEVWNGISARFMYGAGTEVARSTATTNKKDNRVIGLGLNYRNGPLLTQFSISNKQLPDGSGGNEDLREVGISASYDFGLAKLYGFYVDQQDDTRKAVACGGLAAGNCSDAATYAAGVNVPVLGNRGSIKLIYARKDLQHVSNEDADMWSVAYQHDLSKRTALYAIYSQLDNDSQAGFNINGTGLGAVRNGASPKAFGIGMRHTF